MTTNASTPSLTAALEDYLETIFEVTRDRKVARVRDIAKARRVKPGSVTPALKRLSELGLIDYERREFFSLTEKGKKAARRVASRHRILFSFFHEVLDMPSGEAERDACAMEHHLSNTAMDRMVRFFEYIRDCPSGRSKFIDHFHRFDLGVEGPTATTCKPCSASRRSRATRKSASLLELRPGQIGRIRRVLARGAIRQRLLDMGVLPDVRIEVERVAPSGNPIWVKLNGYQMSLRRKEAEAIKVDRDS